MSRSIDKGILRIKSGGKGPLCLLMFILVTGQSIQAATYYVDGNCPTAGNGSSPDCLSSPTTNNPKKTINDGIALLAAPGDKLRIRGIHSAHGAETGNFDGRYSSNVNDVANKNGASGNNIVIEAYGWTAVGARTQEQVFIDATVAPGTNPTVGWTQCLSCPAGSGAPSGTTCPGVPGVCSDVWYVNGSTSFTRVEGAVKPLGEPAYRVKTVAELTNSNAGYNSARCSNETWRACNTSTDCNGGGTCSVTSPEIDSFTCNNIVGGCATAYIYARWGSGANAPGGTNNRKPYVLTNTIANGFRVLTGSSFVEIRGFIIRHTRDAGVMITGSAHHITIKDNVFTYGAGIPSGGDYGLCLCGGDNLTATDNEFMHLQSEAIHSSALALEAPSNRAIINNHIHDIGNQTVTGPASLGTPLCLTLGNGPGGAGNYSGSVIDGNLFRNMKSNTFSYCINLENNSDGWVIRNNVIRDVSAECIRFNSTTIAGVGSNNDIKVYNNLLINCGNGSSGQGAILLAPSGSGVTANNNLIYNNTIVNPKYPAITGYGSVTGNLIRNNILYSSGSQRLLDWNPTDPSNVFQNNLLYSATLGSGTLATWKGVNYSCSTISAIVPTDLCADPLFVSSSAMDFHLKSGSPAANTGSDIGMPAGRLSIYNSLAGSHGMPSYAEGSSKIGLAWDLGVSEYGGGTPSAPSAALNLPSMTPAGSFQLTLSTSVPVVQLPGPVTFQENDGTTTVIILSGSVPGSVFTGTFAVNSTVADGSGVCSLPVSNLVDQQGNLGNSITSGGTTIIEKTPPSTVNNLRFGGS